MSDDYEIGYKKPPRDTQFKKGESGNPKGRPKGRKSSADHMRAILNKKITVREGDKILRITSIEALVQTLMNRALKGDLPAARLLFAMGNGMGIFEASPDPDTAVCGVLIVPPKAASSEEWSRLYAPPQIDGEAAQKSEP